MHSKPIDKITSFEILDDFKPFDQRFDIYCRSEWDPEIKSAKAEAFFKGHYMPFARSRKSEGFQQRDYALRNASWHVTNVIRDLRRTNDDLKEGFLDPFTCHEDGWPEPFQFKDKEESTADILKTAKLCGADLFGVCAFDERWMYSGKYSEKTQQSEPLDIPDDLSNVIVIGESMDSDLTKTVPSALSGSATGLGYSKDVVTLLTLTQYIRNLGYRAYATMNDSALAIPLAVQAGFGEVGRHSLLITEEYGPRLRLGKIFTDIPLNHSKPKKFGVKEFCDICPRCAQACPPKAIPFDQQSKKVHSVSNIPGIIKWTTNAEKCFKFWSNQNSDCSICIRVCPYNRDFTKLSNRLWRKLAGTRLRRLALWLDDKCINRGRYTAGWWRSLKAIKST